MRLSAASSSHTTLPNGAWGARSEIRINVSVRTTRTCELHDFRQAAHAIPLGGPANLPRYGADRLSIQVRVQPEAVARGAPVDGLLRRWRCGIAEIRYNEQMLGVTDGVKTLSIK